MQLDRCPETLAMGHDTYGKTCFESDAEGRKVSPILHIFPYVGNLRNGWAETIPEYQYRGAGEFSVLLEKNRLTSK